MRPKRCAQRSLFEAPPVDHAIGEELSAISAGLDENPTLLDRKHLGITLLRSTTS